MNKVKIIKNLGNFCKYGFLGRVMILVSYSNNEFTTSEWDKWSRVSVMKISGSKPVLYQIIRFGPFWLWSLQNASRQYENICDCNLYIFCWSKYELLFVYDNKQMYTNAVWPTMYSKIMNQKQIFNTIHTCAFSISRGHQWHQIIVPHWIW